MRPWRVKSSFDDTVPGAVPPKQIQVSDSDRY